MIPHPTKICIPVETAFREWTVPGGICQQKMDGCFTVFDVAGSKVAGEIMPDGSKYAFDLVEHDGEDVRAFWLRMRWAVLGEMAASLADNGIRIVPSVPSERGATFLRQVLNNGDEGCVLKGWGNTYSTPMLAAKRSQIHLCTVTAIGPGQSIAVKDSVTGQFRGKVPAKGGAADVLRVGDRVRIEAACLHESGLFREAKLCRQYKISGP